MVNFRVKVVLTFIVFFSMIFRSQSRGDSNETIKSYAVVRVTQFFLIRTNFQNTEALSEKKSISTVVDQNLYSAYLPK